LKSLFLINAKSGARRLDVASMIRGHLSSNFEIAACQRKEDLDAILDQAGNDGFEVIYAVGGDGTVHEIAKRLVGRPLALGIVPTGSGNGFARHLGVPCEPRASLRASTDAAIVSIDTAEMDDNRFVGVMGLGFDAVIADRFANAGTRGLRTYVRVGARAFLSYRPEEYEIEIDGRTIVRRALVVVVANSAHYGNNARIAPLASVTDGLLDVVIVEDFSLAVAPFMMRRLLNGTFHRSKRVTTLQGREITIRRHREGPAHLDGEPLTLPETIRVRVKPRSLRVLVPRSNIKL
jgi:diacylglycerol kinase (ATP)